MSGQQVGSVVGGIVGSFIPVVGTALGSVIGGILGGWIAPTQITGPRLTDGMAVTAQDGIANPWGFGTFPVGCNIIWAADYVEHEETDDGKGSGQEVTTFRYTRSYAVGICRGNRVADGTYTAITGILRATKNGKIVYDVTADAPSDMPAQNAKFLQNHTFYLGSETQLPDPTIESYLGAGNAPAYPGQVYMVAEDDETREGEVGQWEFVVSTGGENISLRALAIGWDENELNSYYSWSATGATWSNSTGVAAGVELIALDRGRFFVVNGSVSGWTDDLGVTVNTVALDNFGGPHGGDYRNGILMIAHGDSGIWRSTDRGATFNVIDAGSSSQYVKSAAGFSVSILYNTTRVSFNDGFTWNPGGDNGLYIGSIPPCAASTPSAVAVAGLASIVTENPVVSITRGGLTWTARQLAESGAPVVAICGRDEGGTTLWIAADGDGNIYWSEDDFATVNICADTMGVLDIAYNGDQFILVGTNVASTSPAIATTQTGQSLTPAASFPYLEAIKLVAANPDPAGTIDPDTIALSTIVAECCRRSGLADADIDVSELTDEIDGFKVASLNMTGESIIQSLMPGYFFDACEADDKLVFIKRGGAPTFELTIDDLAEREGDALEEIQAQEVELLRKVHVKTMDPAAGYVVTTQTAERRTSTVAAKGEQVIEIPVVTDHDTAAQMAHKRMKAAWGEPRRFRYTLPYTRPDITPTDVGTITDKKGRVQMIRVERASEDEGRIETEASLNRQAAYTSNVSGVPALPPVDTSPGIIGPTLGWVGNLPSLRTSDNVPGVYIGGRGYQRAWGGYALFLSADGGESYQRIGNYTQPTQIGNLTGDITASGEPIPVFQPVGTLSTITDTQLANRGNAFAITTDGESEIGQFQTATLGDPSEYDLTDTVRGLLDTTAAAHSTTDPFVMLAGTHFVPLDISLAGKTLLFKFVSFGTSLDDTEAYEFTFQPKFTSVVVSSLTVSGDAITVGGDPIYVVT